MMKDLGYGYESFDKSNKLSASAVFYKQDKLLKVDHG